MPIFSSSFQVSKKRTLLEKEREERRGEEGMVSLKELLSITKTLLVLILTIDDNGVNGGSSEVNEHLEKGRKLLQEGNLPDALHHYSLAVEGDPNNYLTYFKRATVYLALGQTKRALPDLEKVLQLKPDFHKARLERANTLTKLGKLELSIQDYKLLVATENSATKEAKEMLNRATEVVHYIEEIDSLLSNHDYSEELVWRLQASIELCPWNIPLREKRASLFESMGQYQSAISDIKMLTKLIPDNTGGYLRVSTLYYKLGEDEDSLKEIRECLKLDPDHKECFTFYKKVKKLSKQLTSSKEAMNEDRYSDAIDKLKGALKTEGQEPEIVRKVKVQMCTAHAKLGDKEGIKWCDEALTMDSDNIDILCDKSELYIANEEYEEAIRVYQHAANINNQNQRVKDGLHRAQNLLKQSQKRDYYKILGVKRSASKKDINKAYRQLAKEWHPDKYEGEDKKKAEKMFYDIAAAKEVLTDKEMRERFDNGEDPLDPEQQHQGGGHGFPHGFPFGGGGFTFKFNF